jgi:hypothetical protein
MTELLKNRKKELEEIYGFNLMQIKKSTKLLKLIINDVVKLNDVFTKTEILELINCVFETNIKYNNFYKFYSKYYKNINIQNNIETKHINNSTLNWKKEEVNSQIKIANISHLKDDGELKQADKSEFK